MGKGLSVDSVYRSGKLAIGLAIILFAGFWFYLFSGINL